MEDIKQEKKEEKKDEVLEDIEEIEELCKIKKKPYFASIVFKDDEGDIFNIYMALTYLKDKSFADKAQDDLDESIRKSKRH